MRDFAKISDIQIRDFMLGFIHDEIYEFHRLRWDAVIEKTPIEIQAMYQEFVAFGKTR
jgi:hypothetical protein